MRSPVAARDSPVSDLACAGLVGLQVVVEASSSSTYGVALPIVVSSPLRGTSTFEHAYTFNAPGSIQQTTPNNGPASGHTVVTLAGTNLGDGNDISAVTFDGMPATIVNQSATEVVVSTPAYTGAGAATVMVKVQSLHFGVTTSSYTYNAGTSGGEEEDRPPSFFVGQCPRR